MDDGREECVDLEFFLPPDGFPASAPLRSKRDEHKVFELISEQDVVYLG